MPARLEPYQPYAAVHDHPSGPGDARPTAIQVVDDCHVAGTLRDKTVLITGCTSGTGTETARALYHAGARLFLTARDLGKQEKVIEDIVSSSSSSTKDVPRPVALELHLDSLASVREAAKEFETESGGKLNILICNAGVMAGSYILTKDNFESHMGTNHFAHFLLIRLLTPLLLDGARTSHTTSRVILLSSSGHRLSPINFADLNFTSARANDSFDKLQAYAQSKTANIYTANALTRHYAARGLIGLSVHPGGVLTDLFRSLSADEMQSYGAGNEAVKRVMKNPAQGAATTVWAAVSPWFDGEGRGGQYLADVGETRSLEFTRDGEEAAGPGYAAHAYNEEAEERLWEVSCQAVGVSVD